MPTRQDLALAGALVVWAQGEVWTGVVGGPKAAAALTALAMTAPLVLRRTAPLAAAAGVLAGMAARTAIDTDLSEGLTPVLVIMLALYSVGAHLERRSAVAGLVGSLAFLAVAMALDPRQPVDDLPYISLFAVLPWAAGLAMRRRRLEARELVSRAERAAGEERARIARELHDVVAHSVSVMVVQAQAAQRVLEGEQRSAREALESIESTGRSALVEMRRLLGMLRQTDEELTLAPQPSLDHLDLLLAQVREAGLPVELTVEGRRRPLPPGVDLSAYRIVQEALTNALKHAGPARARVVLRYEPDALALEIVDDGRGPGAENGAGHGLAGMRERVSLYGGTLESGARGERGYSVRASLPT